MSSVVVRRAPTIYNRSVSQPKSRNGLIIGLIIAAVVIVIIVIVVLIIINRRKSSSGGGSVTPSPPGIKCASDSECSSGVCSDVLGFCVECKDNTKCVNANKSQCLVLTGSCVECLDNTLCTSPAVCDRNQCCNDTPPQVISIVPTGPSLTNIIINYSYSQPITPASRVIAVITTADDFHFVNNLCDDVPAKACISNPDCASGATCDSFRCKVIGCNTYSVTGSFQLFPSNSSIKLYSGITYKIRLKILYSCGSKINTSTLFADPFEFTMPLCNSNLITSVGTYNTNNENGAGVLFYLYDYPDDGISPDFQVEIRYTSNNSLTEPNLFTQTTTKQCFSGGLTLQPFKSVLLPYSEYQLPFGVASFRLIKLGSSCNSVPFAVNSFNVFVPPPVFGNGP